MTSIWNKFNSLRQEHFHFFQGPKDLPQQLGSHLVIKKEMDSDYVWKLRCVLKNTEKKHHFLFRIFDPMQASGANVRVKDYESLNEHPELILYQGEFNKFSNEVDFQEQIEHAA